jgi:hypothetical protein
MSDVRLLHKTLKIQCTASVYLLSLFGYCNVEKSGKKNSSVLCELKESFAESDIYNSLISFSTFLDC